MMSRYGFDVDDVLRGVAAPSNLPASHTINPYWDIVRTIPGNGIEWRRYGRWQPDWTATLYSEKRIMRNDLCGQYTWSIPDPASLDFVAQWLSPSAVEIGAGTGYWAWQLSQLGVDVVAYDLYPPQHTGQNHYHSPRNEQGSDLIGETREVYFDVRAGNAQMAAQHPDRTLFLCWPPMSDMALEAVTAYTGKRIVYIGEGDGGCTADEAFFKRLDRTWKEVAVHQPVQWSGIHDYITVYERKRPRKARGEA